MHQMAIQHIFKMKSITQFHDGDKLKKKILHRQQGLLCGNPSPSNHFDIARVKPN